MRNVPAVERKHVLGLIQAYGLMIVLSPIFLILTLLYLALHPYRGDGEVESNTVGELAIL